MFGTSSILFCALVAFGALAAPVGKRASACNATDVQDLISQMSDVAQQILAVNFVAPDPFRQTADDAATFDTVVSAINDAATAAGQDDFDTVASKLAFIDGAINGVNGADGLLTGEAVQDGTESGIDLQISDLADKAVTAVANCAAVPAAPAASTTAAAAPAATQAADDAEDDGSDSDNADVATCDASSLQDKLNQLQSLSQDILNIGLVAPDPFRQNDADKAKFNTVISAVNDAVTAAGTNDFATVSSKLAFVDDAINGDGGLLSSQDIQDGQESGEDVEFATLLDDAKTLVAACA